MNDDYVIQAIRECADELLLKTPRCCLPVGYFELRSYRKWAVDEILKTIEDSRNQNSPIVAVEEFICKMNDFICRNANASLIFSIARDMAIELFDILSAMQ